MEDAKAVREGMELIYQKFVKYLADNGVKAMDTAPGVDFDTDLHDAITTIPAPTPELKGKIVDTTQKGYMLNDKVLRQMAEFDNYRKRTLKEKAELILNGGEKTITALLPVMDDLDRALENMDKTDDVATLKEGVELIIQKLVSTLGAQGLKRMETQGQAFDTDFHEAVALVPGDESKKNQIIDCVQPGYLLNEKVIRHAKVVVGQ